MSPALVSSHISKSTKIFHGDDCFSRLRRNLRKHVFDCMYSPFIKITYTLPPPPAPVSLEQFLRAIWNCCLLGRSPHFAPNKTACKSHFVHFFKLTVLTFHHDLMRRVWSGHAGVDVTDLSIPRGSFCVLVVSVGKPCRHLRWFSGLA